MKLSHSIRYRIGKGDKFVGVDLRWEVFNIHLPESLLEKKEDIKELIREAFDAYGQYGDRRYVKDLSVEEQF